MKKILMLSLIFVLVLSLFGCNTVDAEGLWQDATYRHDKTFGKGDTEITLVVEAGANVLVAGSAVYGKADIPAAIAALRV